jgi:hypothetical protein
MTRIGKFWTDSVAYVALALGAGLSIAGNVADTYRVREHLTDELDIVMAVAWPALVVLMVEIFVSTRWRGLGLAMQCLRWLGCVSIGAMAMTVSWVHLNDLMASRGQMAIVAILGPLAIDALAIMATALILAGRGHSGQVDTREDTTTPVQDIDVDRVVDKHLAGWDMALATEMAEDMDALARERVRPVDQWTLEAVQDIRPVSPAPVRPESVPAEARILFEAWATAGAGRPPVGEADRAVAAAAGVTPRSARRWRTSLGIRA